MSRYSRSKATSPFDSDSDTEIKATRNSTQPSYGSSSSYGTSLGDKNRYKNNFRDSGGIQNQSTQELEIYVVYKEEETTQQVNNCLRIAEEISECASNTFVQLHQQGQQIERIHLTVVDIDQDLSRGEKLLGKLGGIFSRKWKPRKNHKIQGPVIARDDAFAKKGSHMEQRQRLGLNEHKTPSNPRKLTTEPASALEKVEIEKMKQDDALDDLSNMLGKLKVMAQDMESEIESQKRALVPVGQDEDELISRLKGANDQTRKLLGK